jgi:hypothetical protein
MRQRVATWDLNMKVADAKTAAASGWKKEAVMDAIRLLIPTDNVERTPEDVQNGIRDGDIGYLNRTEQIELWHLFVHEYEPKNGKVISHYIVAANQPTTDYLYCKRYKYASWESLLCLAPFDIGGDGTVYSVRGIGTRIFAFHQIFDRLMSKAIDALSLNMGLLVKGRSSTDTTKVNLLKRGLLSILPDNMEVIPSNLSGFAQDVWPVIRQLATVNESNTALFRNGIGEFRQPNSATEAQILSTEGSGLSQAQLQHEIDALTAQYRRQIELLARQETVDGQQGYSACLEFKTRCMKAGVPEEALRHIQYDDIEFAAGHGGGSLAQRIQNAMQILSVLGPSQGPAEQYAMQRELVTSIMGERYADDFVTPLDDRTLPTSDDSIAVLENSSMRSGGAAIVSPGQSHVRHVPLHLAAGTQVLGQIQNGDIDLQAGAIALNAIGAHTAEHIQFMKDDPLLQDEVKRASEQLNQLAKFTDQVTQQLAEQQRAAEMEAMNGTPEQQMSEDAQLEALRIEQDTKLKAAKLQADIQLKAQKAAADSARKDRVAQDAMLRKAAVAASDEEINASRAYPETQPPQ